MKSAVLVSVLALTAYAVWDESALARNYLNCLSKKVIIVDAPKGATSSSVEENFGFWIDEPTQIVTFADGGGSMSAASMTTGLALQAVMCPTSWIAKMAI